MVVEASQRYFTQPVLNRLFKEIVYEDYNASAVHRGGLSLGLDSFFKIFSTGSSMQVEILKEYR